MTAAVVMFVFGVVTALASLTLPIGTVRAPGSGLFPLALGILLAVLSLAQGVSVYRAQATKARTSTGAPVPPPAKPLSEETRRVLLFAAAVAVAVALLPVIGYGFTILVLMVALLRILGIARWPVVGAVSTATAIACWFVFVRILAIPLPAGLPGF
ncbi:tripartite tricarboxylate transporter TctB family protein [Xanthobacteraceae bacterium Astr-EGSB]|uniref:tripartite tricarboxylate transporter TctB family protein n=1 Tax=Astrobacterium formosum TaxID=3069710 RepID=UPI0027B54613|nr:tripartite tricarboxylate transporter TctB family protein [Xanthobacteraceae bacterium Astr-EGSB]